ncbi:MAG: endonuclease MutS2 [Bacteroidota bacterium]
MVKISNKTLTDLDFPRVREQLAEFCITETGKEKALSLAPYKSFKKSLFALHQTQEYKSSEWEEKPIPNHGFDSVDREIKLLAIENTKLEISSFAKIKHLAETANTQLKYFQTYQHIYQNLFRTSQSVEFTSQIPDEINKILNRYGEIKDDATPKLAEIRKSLMIVKSKIGSSFTNALSRYAGFDYLHEIRESVVENIRVLAVMAMHRKKVKGRILGHSKTGSIVYIQPQETQHYDTEFNNLIFEEEEEINRILKALTDFIRPFSSLLKDYQYFLSEIDLISAKVAYAKLINAVLPKISTEKEIYLKEAYHPILFLENQKAKQKTYPQDISLDEATQIIVISGPNAGGKSITLKTVGLIQLMLQSGMLAPVHEYSRISFFDKILTDIGDNQSIENHLSTYSYRLKNMRHFLKQCDDKTLFLIDEFGTGSDPELGGALAETFLEVFYEKKSFGIITTHYANLKMMANENKEIVNANMMFDSHTLRPLFKLKLGEAGSSFTFEVAQKNGIPYSLINRSKKKVERGKIRFDKSIAKLQMERSKLAKNNKELTNKKLQAQQEQDKFDEINTKIQEKLERYQELYDANQRFVTIGEKINSLSEQYFNNKNKKQLIANFLKLVEKENSKRIQENKREQKRRKQQEHRLKQEVESKVDKIRTKKKEQKKKEENHPSAEKPKPKLYVNDSVRIIDGKAVGTIDKFEKEKAVVNYGMFTTTVNTDQLELVKRAKK